MIPLRDNIISKSTPLITWLLILINCYIFTIELRFATPAGLEKFVADWAVIPSALRGGPSVHWMNLLTATFLHGGWMHLIGNMLFLYVFGPSVEDRMGSVRYLFFYLLIGIFANLVQAQIVAASKLPLLGASGAIAGVLGAYFFYYPYARILTLIPFFIFSKIVEIPAFLFLGVWFLIQTFHGSQSIPFKNQAMQNLGGVAWWAHASGFIGGLVLAPGFSLKSKKSGRQRI